MNASRPAVALSRPHLARRLLAEFLGTALLVTIVVGSGIAAASLSPDDVGLQLLENSLATALGLAVLILMFGPVSGAHFNPVVTLVDWMIGARAAAGLPLRDVGPYIAAQVLGGSAGAVLANVMFELPSQLSSTDRVTGGHLVAEVVATGGLVLLIFSLARTSQGSVTAAAVGAYIGAAYWFTSSTSFANPAVTVARVFSDTFAGIAPGSVPPFILMQLLGGALGLALVLVLYPTAARAADDVVVPHSVDAKL
ncbi:aquaporin family protein [Labedella phragmitis]|uniref:Aquaporin family protein n=1 Tax=Labedella phragmitis TaxID=2498849 RepID=A0A444PX34_9MICO|nr:MIP/aquaporin family protein [Labedella phragmitis]RWZ52450.1 aquaporin family protein [Labedella phragmitis]